MGLIPILSFPGTIPIPYDLFLIRPPTEIGDESSFHRFYDGYQLSDNLRTEIPFWVLYFKYGLVLRICNTVICYWNDHQCNAVMVSGINIFKVGCTFKPIICHIHRYKGKIYLLLMYTYALLLGIASDPA